MKGKKILATLFAIGLFFGGTFIVNAVPNVNLHEYIIVPELVVDKQLEFLAAKDIEGTPEIEGIDMVGVAPEDVIRQYEVVALTKAKFDEIKAAEEAYEAIKDDPTAITEEIDAVKKTLEDVIAAECDNLVTIPNQYFTITKDSLNWIDCEQTTTYTLVFFRLTVESTIYDGYKLQELKDPEVCEAPTPTPVTTPNPKTGIANPYVLGGVSTAITATALMVSRKKRYI